MRTCPSLTIACVLASTSFILAGPRLAYEGSDHFERLKSLAGTWQGTMDMGEGPVELKVVYRVVAGGSALEERTFAGTPMEMVTMYHEKAGKLALTHYCMLHNQPSMLLTSGDRQKLHFDFDPACGIDPKTEEHMHALVLTFVNPDTITQRWTHLKGGQAQSSLPITLKRTEPTAPVGEN